MFWKKKEQTTESTTSVADGKAEKLPGPKELHLAVGKHLIVQLKQDPDWVWSLKECHRQKDGNKNQFYFRIFDQNKIGSLKVKDYYTFDSHPELVLYQGWYDKNTHFIEMEKKSSAPVTEKVDVKKPKMPGDSF